MPGIRLAATVAITFKPDDDLADMDPVEAVEAFQNGLRGDLRAAYDQVEAIEVTDVHAGPAVIDPRMELTVEWLDLAAVALEETHMAIVDLKRSDAWRRAPKGMQKELAVSHQRYMDAAAAMAYVRDRLRQELAGVEAAA